MMIPDKIKGFECYDDGNVMIGVADVVLPNIAHMTDTIKGAGIAGEIDTPAVGNVQSMTTTINWRSLVEENIIYAAPKTYHFDFRGSVQLYDRGTGDYTSKSAKVVMKAIPKTFTPGNFDTASQMGTSLECEVVYLKISIEDKELVEIDKFNYIFMVNGMDYLAKVRRDIGRQ
jgi:hypothetical protein